jgi:hypothetical protein
MAVTFTAFDYTAALRSQAVAHLPEMEKRIKELETLQAIVGWQYHYSNISLKSFQFKNH